jgi:hypothetical protein
MICAVSMRSGYPTTDQGAPERHRIMPPYQGGAGCVRTSSPSNEHAMLRNDIGFEYRGDQTREVAVKRKLVNNART